MTLRRLLAVLFAFALIASACGGDDDTESTGDDDGVSAEEPADEPAEEPADEPAEEPSEEPADEPAEEPADEPAEEPAAELTASWTGVTADTITVGISMLDFDLLKELQLSPQGWGDQQLVWQTLIDAVNAGGGVNGRMIEPIYRFYSPLGTTEAEAACLELTEDNEVFAVLAGFVGPAEPANTCITGRGETVLVGGRQSPERLAESTAPWFETATTRTRRLELFMSLVQQEGLLEGREIALIGGIQAEEEFNQARELLPEFGIEPVVEVLMEAADGDIPAVDAVWEALSERVDVSGADTALIITSVSGNIRGIRNNGLDIDIWTIDNDSLNNLGESVEPVWADGVLTISGLGDPEAWEHPTVAPCRETFETANPDVDIVAPADAVEGDERWYTAIMAYCRYLDAFVQIATAAGPDLTHDTFREAAFGLGDFELAAQPFNSLGPDKLDANDTARLGIYDSDVGARGQIEPFGDLVDATP